MKKILLIGFLLITSCTLHAQVYYPAPDSLWGYENVVSDGGGDFNNPTTGKSGAVIDDAKLNYPTAQQTDAFDGAFEFFVNTTDSVYTESGIDVIGGVDTTGTTITSAEQLIDGFYVSKKYYFSTIDPVVRATFKIRNPTSNVMLAKIGINTNLGSDSQTVMDTSSTGGDTLVNADRWMVTTDSTQLNTGDPILTWVRFGPGTIASSPVFGKKPELHVGNYIDTVYVSVPANSYSLILQLCRLDSNTEAARINVGTFNTAAGINNAGYLDGLSDTDLTNVVNWDFSSIICNPVSINNPQSVCSGGSYTINGHVYTIPGTYNDTLQRVLGCDSIIVTQLTVDNLDLDISVSNDSIIANQTGATYQWLDCNNGNSAIPGDTNQSHLITGDGNFAVIITNGACSDTSACQSVLGIPDISNILNQITVYPNPCAGIFYVSMNDGSGQIKNIKVFNTIGAVVYQTENNDVLCTVDITNQAPGIYILQVATDSGIIQQKIVKQ